MNIFRQLTTNLARLFIDFKQSSLSIIFSTLLLVVIILYSKKLLDFNAFFASLGGIITFYLGMLKQKIEDDKIFKELFISFNSRYSDELNDLLNILRIDDGKHLDHINQQLLIDYFNLCSEEYLWYLKGRIPNKVWKAWFAGIKLNLLIPQVKELFEKETKEQEQKDSYYGFAEYYMLNK